MNRPQATFAAALLALAVGSPAMAAVTVEMDQTAAVKVSGQIAQVIVGNPTVADVNVIGRHELAVLGRSYGVTNVVALDPTGRQIFQTTINVSPASTGRISLFRGPELYNYACNNRCERTPMPGENQGPYQQGVAAYSDYAGRAKSAAGSGGG